MNISEDKLFLLIKTMKEARDLINGTDDKRIIRKHKINIEIDMLNIILSKGGIDSLVSKYETYKTQNTIINKIRTEEK